MTTTVSRPGASSTWGALFRNETRLLARQPAVLIWTVILPVTAIIVMAAIPAARRPLDGFGGISVLQAYQPTLMIFASSMMALQMLPTLLGQYRELGYLRRLRTTPVSPWQLLGAMVILMLLVTMVEHGRAGRTGAPGRVLGHRPDRVRPGLDVAPVRARRVANAGVHGTSVDFPIDREWINNITITTGLVNATTAPDLLEDIKSGKIEPEKFVTHRFTFDQWDEAYDTFSRAAGEHALKVIVTNA